MTEQHLFTKPKMLLFDVGNVLICDDTSAIFVYRCLYGALGGARWGTPMDLVNARANLLSRGKARDLWQVVAHLLPTGIALDAFRTETRRKLYAEWGRYSPPMPEMAEVVYALAKHYRIGLLANQPPTVEGVLRERGLWDCFEIKGISALVGMEKPTPEFFQWAFDQAGLPPAEIMMVGDRLDNDVRPAKAQGMSTCWLDFLPLFRPWVPEDSFSATLQPCRNLVCVPPDIRPSDDSYTPTVRVTSPEDMLNQLINLAEKTQ